MGDVTVPSPVPPITEHERKDLGTLLLLLFTVIKDIPKGRAQLPPAVWVA